MRICVIFNPTAKGDKARNFRRHLDQIAAECALKQTVAAGGARPLAAEAIREGFDTIVAAGGDGTLNETLNGIGDVPDGFDRVRLGVLPLGTVNVFAKELAMPTNLKQAWQILRAGREMKIDLPAVEFTGPTGPERRYFAQLAGSGLDARAIELTNWQFKKAAGPLAYIWAGFKALTGPPSQVTATNGTQSETGELVLIGNGRFYGGKYPIHPGADLTDGLLEVCVFPKTNWYTLFRCARMFLFGTNLPNGVGRTFQSKLFTLNSISPAALEIDGELVGHIPAKFSIQPLKLRIVIP